MVIWTLYFPPRMFSCSGQVNQTLRPALSYATAKNWFTRGKNRRCVSERSRTHRDEILDSRSKQTGIFFCKLNIQDRQLTIDGLQKKLTGKGKSHMGLPTKYLTLNIPGQTA